MQRSRSGLALLAAMIVVSAVVGVLGFWLPTPLYELIEQTAKILGGTA